MRKLHPEIVEKIKQVPFEKIDKVDFWDSFVERITRKGIQEVVGNSDFLNDCYNLLKNELPFIEKYFFHEEHPSCPSVSFDIKEVHLLASFINELNNQVYHATQLLDIIPSLVGYRFLKIDCIDMLKRQEFREKNLLQLRDKLSDFLMAFNMKIENLPDSSYSDRKITETMEEGIDTSNIEMVYDSIRSIEKGAGFKPFPMLEQLSAFTRLIDFELFIQVLNKKERIPDVIYLLQGLTTLERRKVLRHPGLENKWCLYEAIRKILRDIHHDAVSNMSDCFYLEVSEALSRLASLDVSFFEYTIISHKINRHFSKILALALSTMDKKYLDIYVNTIDMDTDAKYLENNRLFMEVYIENSDKEKVYDFCQQVFFKWQDLLKAIVYEEKYIDEIVYSNYYFSIVYYLHMEYDESSLCIEIQQIIKEMKENRYTWKKSSILERSSYFVGLTKLHTWGVIFESYGEQRGQYEQLQEEVEEIIQERKLWLRYFREIKMPSILKDIHDLYF